jgi:hypothetical protein
VMKHGLYNFSDRDSSESQSYAFSSWFCDKEFSSSSEAESFGAEAAFPFKGVPVKLGFDSEKESWDDWYSEYCKSTELRKSSSSILRERIAEISKDMVDLAKTCLQAPGLHMWIEASWDPKRFLIIARFNSQDPEKIPSTIVTLGADKNLECEESNFEVRAQGKQIACKRKGSDPVLISVNSSVGPVFAKTLTLPAIPAASPPPPVACPTPKEKECEGTYVTRGESLASKGGCGFGVMAPEHRFPDSVYYIKIFDDTRLLIKHCDGPSPHFVTPHTACDFTLNGRAWSAKLEAVRDLGSNMFDSVIVLRRLCGG